MLLNALLVVLSMVFVVAIFEFYLYMTNYGALAERNGSQLTFKTSEFSHTAALNELDLRGPEIEQPSPQTYRILALGDSYTFGVGVHDDETFVRQWEELLNEKARDGPIDFEIVNGGVGGGPSRQLAWLRAVGLDLEPDCIVHFFYIGNDVYDELAWKNGTAQFRQAPEDGAFIPDEHNAAPPEEPDSLLDMARRLRAANWLLTRLAQIPVIDEVLFKMGLRYRNDGLFLEELPDVEQRGWHLVYAALRRMHALSAEAGAGFAVVVIPTSAQLRYGDVREAGQDNRKPNQLLKEFLTEQGIEQVDLLDLFERADDQDRLYYHRDIHWTAFGHDFVAQALAERTSVPPGGDGPGLCSSAATEVSWDETVVSRGPRSR